MPNAPLPKPAAPTPPKPPQPVIQSGTSQVSVQPVPQLPSPPKASVPGVPAPGVPAPGVPSTSIPEPVFPPQSQLKIGAPPVPAPVRPAPFVPAQPASSGMSSVAPPARPMIPVARPGSPLPTQSVPPPPLPGAAPKPLVAQPQPAQQPPRTLTALQSMSSSQLPAGAGDVKSSVTPPPLPSAGINAAPSLPPPDAKPPEGSPQSPQFAEPKKSILRFLPFILVGVVVLAIIGFVVFRFFGSSQPAPVPSNTSNSSSNTNSSGSGTSGTGTGTNTASNAERKVIEYWGLWEPTETMTEVIKDYEAKNPNVTINYTKQSHKDYRLRLRTALVEGTNGPDIFRYHASWVPMMTQELAPLPSSVMTSSEYQNTFYPVAAEMLNVKGQIVGIPLMYEGLALYYNTEIFSTAVVDPPKTWSDLRTLASKLTVKAGSSIKRSGIALGNASNVEHFSDIIAVLMMQNGADMTKPNSPQTRDALLFYTNFIKSDDVWDETLPLSSVAFARGDVAMIFAPSWRALEIKQMNPNLPFKVVPLPQLSNTRISYANFWAEGVNAQSENKQEAWEFLKYLSSAEVQKKLYANQSEVRPFGEIYSRKDLANELASDPIVSAYLQDAPYAKSWYMSSYTHDDGLNDQIIKYYEDAVNELVKGGGTEDVLIKLDQGVQQVLRQYNVSSTTNN